MISKIKIKDLGIVDYKSAWDFQKEYHGKVVKGVQPDTLFFVEHEPVYTFGKNADKNHLLQSANKDIKIFNVERGGDVTFHGPGQIVGYPIIDLNRYVKSVSWYMRTLEEVLIKTLIIYGIEAEIKEGLTGVWVGDEKIGAQGVRISRWVTMHGFALNVNTDLTYFDGIIPCGIFEHGVTSMEKILGKKQNIVSIKNRLAKLFNQAFKINESVEVA
tara:strand:+ start:3449 stop:4096 length:648 start_codon:yes stop_codon:yes gene_type:complete